MTRIQNAPEFRGISAITADGSYLYVSAETQVPGANKDWVSNLWRIPIYGGAAEYLGRGFALSLTVIGSTLFWVDPGAGPWTDTEILSVPVSGTLAAHPIYTGSLLREEPIVDGSGLTTDGNYLYVADEVQGRVFRLNPNGSEITFLGSRYGGLFDAEHPKYLAMNEGTLYFAESGGYIQGGNVDPQVLRVDVPQNKQVDRFQRFHVLCSGSPFKRVSGLAVAKDTLFVADQGANTLWTMPTTGGQPTAFAMQPSFRNLGSVAYANGSLFVTSPGDQSNNIPGFVYRVTLPTNFHAMRLVKSSSSSCFPSPSSSSVQNNKQPTRLETMATRQFRRRLSPGESKLLRAVQDGTIAWAGQTHDPTADEYNVALSADWGSERVIHADLVHWLVTDHDAGQLIKPAGIRIVGAVIIGSRGSDNEVLHKDTCPILDDGGLALLDVNAPYPITCEHCVVPGGIWVANAKTGPLLLSFSCAGPISAPHLETWGGLALVQSSVGPVDVRAANIAGDLYCSSKVSNNWKPDPYQGVEMQSEPVFNGRGAIIGGNVSLSFGYLPEGVTDLSAARVSGNLNVNYSDLSYDGHGQGLDIEHAEVDGDLALTGVSLADKGQAILRGSSVAGIFYSDASLWSLDRQFPQFELDRFASSAIRLYGASSDPNDVYGIISSVATTNILLGWLNYYGERRRLSLQPYNALANALTQDGNWVDAEKVLEARESARWSSVSMSASPWSLERLWVPLSHFTIGYGYEPLRALLVSFWFVVIGTAVFGIANEAGLMYAVHSGNSDDNGGISALTRTGLSSKQPEHGVATTPLNSRSTRIAGTDEKYYERFNALVYSLDAFVPFVPLGQRNNWWPNADTRWGRWVRRYLWLHTLSGGVLTAMFAGAMANRLHIG